MNYNIDAFKKWWKKATSDQRHDLVKRIGSSYIYLHFVVTDQRKLGPEMAMRIEGATREINKSHPELPIIYQPQICHICSDCPYTK